jgi:hypothetical protein
MPNIVLPHWLNATKLWKHSKTTSFLLKCVPSPAFFSQYQAIVFFGSAMRAFAMSLFGRLEASSHRTRRWRKADSNRWSHLRQRC